MHGLMLGQGRRIQLLAQLQVDLAKGLELCLLLGFFEPLLTMHAWSRQCPEFIAYQNDWHIAL